jgi:hypothetical protein
LVGYYLSCLVGGGGVVGVVGVGVVVVVGGGVVGVVGVGVVVVLY